MVNSNDLVDKHTPSLYLWTERGANRHCKILDTNKAWEQFDMLEETYFQVKEQSQTSIKLTPNSKYRARMVSTVVFLTEWVDHEYVVNVW